MSSVWQNRGCIQSAHFQGEHSKSASLIQYVSNKIPFFMSNDFDTRQRDALSEHYDVTVELNFWNENADIFFFFVTISV